MDTKPIASAKGGAPLSELGRNAVEGAACGTVTLILKKALNVPLSPEQEKLICMGVDGLTKALLETAQRFGSGAIAAVGSLGQGFLVDDIGQALRESGLEPGSVAHTALTHGAVLVIQSVLNAAGAASAAPVAAAAGGTAGALLAKPWVRGGFAGLAFYGGYQLGGILDQLVKKWTGVSLSTRIAEIGDGCQYIKHPRWTSWCPQR